MGIPLLDSQGRLTGEIVGREDVHRSASIPPNERRIYPSLHSAVFDSEGNALEQVRSKTKKFLPGVIFPLHGGHGDEKDMVKQNSHYVFRWTSGGARELKEELGIGVSPRDLHVMYEKLIDFTELCGFENRAYLRVFYMVYDPEKHGQFRVNSSEIQGGLEGLSFRKVTYNHEFELLKGLGKGYAGEIARNMVSLSKKIRSSH